MIKSKAPEQLLNRLCCEIVLPQFEESRKIFCFHLGAESQFSLMGAVFLSYDKAQFVSNKN